MKKSLFISIMLFALLAITACFAADDVTYTTGGYTLSVPAEYNDLIDVSMSADNMLFSVSEIASIEAAKAQGVNDPGIGWLFGIGYVSEEEGHEFLCSEVPGRDIFAKDGDGNYFVFYHPTDVRMVREDYSDQESIAQWTALNEWSYSLKDSFASDNEGLVNEKHGNTTLDSYISRLMYQDDVNFTVSTTEYGPMEANGVKPADYIAPLAANVTFEYLNEEAPDGEYTVLNFPDDDIRFDFFHQDGYTNYIRQVWFQEQNEMLYKAVFEDNSLDATELMNDLYSAMVLANSLGYTADDMVGTWAEKIAGRGYIEIEKTETEGEYSVLINWSASAYQKYIWEMTAKAVNGSELTYDNCKHTILTFTSEDQSTDEVVYENGKGSFSLLSTYELVWNDQQEQAGADTVFVKAK